MFLIIINKIELKIKLHEEVYTTRLYHGETY